MKRMFQISLDTLMVSALPIFLWIILGITLRQEIANIFALTYPLQFLYGLFVDASNVYPTYTNSRGNGYSLRCIAQ